MVTTRGSNFDANTCCRRVSIQCTSTGSGRSAKWIEIGAAWAHDDAKGYNLILNAFPINGQITLRVNEPKPKDEE